MMNSLTVNLVRFFFGSASSGKGDSLVAQMVKNLPANVGDPGSILGSGISSGEENGLPTPVFLPGEFHGQGSLVGYSP